MSRPDFSIEDAQGGLVCGIDEVGRGPLAGPVVAAAVILKRAAVPRDILDIINDSKKLSLKKRAYLFEKIPEFATVSIAECSVAEIDSINILQASLRAMHKAFDGLMLQIPANQSIAALVDGNKAPRLPCATRTVVGGDAKSFSIAAASIMAKHHRDVLMAKYAVEFPQYGWEKNAGYGTAQHLEALEIHGITPHHRLSFAPISKLIVKETNTTK